MLNPVEFTRFCTGKSITLYCDGSERIDTVKQMIQDKEHIPSEDQRLIFAGSSLRVDAPLQTTISRKSAHCILFDGFADAKPLGSSVVFRANHSLF